MAFAIRNTGVDDRDGAEGPGFITAGGAIALAAKSAD
jgi:hypothetical protein